jgi:hypothetical protein
MEPNEQNQNLQKTKNNPTNTVPIRMHKDIARVIRRDLTKLNKKEFGRRISFSDYIAKAIAKISDEDRKELQEQTLSNADKLELLFRKKSKSGEGAMSKEQFLGRLLADYAQAAVDQGVSSAPAKEDSEAST